MKKFLLIILSIVMMIGVLPVGAITANEEISGYYTYTVSEGKATITKASPEISGDVTIPSTLGGYPVTSIDSYAFFNRENLTSITIPNSVTSIGSYAFYRCCGPTTITIPDSVISIGSYAFSNCTSLESVNISDGVVGIGDCAFTNCTSLINITIPDSVTSMGDSAFYNTAYYNNSNNWENDVLYIGNHLIYTNPSITGSYEIKAGTKNIGTYAFFGSENLTSITIPNSVEIIGDYAFADCYKLISITIPNSITSIGNYAFAGCVSLTGITVDNNNEYYSSLNGLLFNKDKTKLLCYPSGKSEESYTIPNGVTSIGEGAVFYCPSLTSITIPNSVTSIDYKAFFNCQNLTSITIPDSVTSIGASVFEYCFSLKSVYYNGSEEEWNEISISDNNEYLINAEIYYNSTQCNIEGHTGGSATCDKKAICTRCGEKYGDFGKHNYKNATYEKLATCKTPGTKTYTCSVCKGTKTETIEKLTTHTYSNNCDKTCNVCEKNRTVGAHKYSNNCDTTCNYCNAKRTIKHTYSNNCDKSCNVCGKTRTVGAHKYSNSCDTTCNYCNAKRTIKHTYTNNCDTSCNVCKATRTITHAYKTTTTKATLSKKGSIVKKCSVCKVTKTTAIEYVKTIKLATTSYTYNGKVKTPSVVVKDSAGKTLKKDTDYTVTYASGRKNAGTYKVTVKMKGNYTGTKTLTFKINPAKISSYKLSTASYTYDGKVKKPTVTVKNSSGTKLTTSSYTVTYASGRKKVGTYKVTIKGKGNYTGTKTLTFKINPAKTTVSKLTAGKKSITVAITKKSTQVTGYQIQYSTSKKFTSAKTKTIASYKTIKTTLKSLSAKKTYYVRVRTYKTVGKTKYYSGWSAYKYVKTK